MKDPKKILVTSPAWVGDIVMSQVLLRVLKQQKPNCEIDVIAQDWAKPLLQHMPEVSNIHTFSFKHGELAFNDRWQTGAQLRPQQYDQAIVLQNSWKSALIPFAAKIAKRTGWVGEWRFGLLNDVRYLDKQQLPLMIQRFAKLALHPKDKLPNELPKPILQVNDSAVNVALQKFNVKMNAKILALCPGAEYGPAKRWPTAYYAEIAKQKALEGWAVWIFGSIKDQSIAAEIQQTTNNICVDFTGKTTLGEAIDLLSLATIVVTNDSGLMHIAAALRRPLVAIYGSSSPSFTPPLSERAKIVSLNLNCSPCFERECPMQHLRCLRDLAPQMVLSAMDEVIRGRLEH